MLFHCSGCDRRCVTYPASACHDQMRQHILSLSLQVACTVAGLSYAQYKRSIWRWFRNKSFRNKMASRTHSFWNKIPYLQAIPSLVRRESFSRSQVPRDSTRKPSRSTSKPYCSRQFFTPEYYSMLHSMHALRLSSDPQLTATTIR